HDIPYGIFHNECPTNHPSEKFAKSHITIGVSTSGNRHKRSKFSIGKSSKSTGQSGKQKQKNDSRSAFITSPPDGRENSRSDDGSNTESCQISYSQAFCQTVVFSTCQDIGYGFLPE